MNETSLYRFAIYDGIRIIQMIIGIVGNGLTTHIIRKLKVLTNGHILIIYVAIAQILVNCVVPLATFADFTGSLEDSSKYHWKKVTLCKDCMYFFTSVLTWVCYFTLSVDRLILMKRPVHYKRSVTRRRLNLSLGVLCVLNIVEFGGTFYYFRNYIAQRYIRSNFNLFENEGLYSILLVNFGLFTLIITGSFIWMAVTLVSKKKKVNYTSNRKSSDALNTESNVTRALFIALGLYIALFGTSFGGAFIIKLVEVQHPDILTDVFFIVYFMTTLVNPFIYFITLKDFRQGYINAMLCNKTTECQKQSTEQAAA